MVTQALEAVIRFHLGDTPDVCFSIKMFLPQVAILGLDTKKPNSVSAVSLGAFGLCVGLQPQGYFRWTPAGLDSWSSIWPLGETVVSGPQALSLLSSIAKKHKSQKRTRGQHGPNAARENKFMLAAAIAESITTGVGVSCKALDQAMIKYPQVVGSLGDDGSTVRDRLHMYIKRQIACEKKATN